jgi:hypothetical protein
MRTDMRFVGGDFRDSVRDLDWFLSYRHSSTIRSRLIKIVDALGYVGLAAVLSGEAALSEAKVYFRDGFLFLEGKACKPGFLTMRRIPGVETPRYRGDRTPYKAPASQAERFLDAVRRHWPMYDADLDALRTEADEWVEAHPEVVPEPDVPTAQIAKRSDDFVIKFPWVRGANMYGLLGNLKAVNSADRRFDPESKTWSFKNVHLGRITEALGAVFENIKTQETDTLTPDGLYDRRPSNGNTRRRYSRRRRY